MLLPLSRSTVAANVVLGTLASVAVALRIVARRVKRLPLKADDYAITLALVMAVGICISGIYAGATNLYAIPIPTMSIAEYVKHEKTVWVDVLLAHLIYGVIKISILLFYKRIFVIQWFQTVANVFMAVVVAWMLAAAFGHIFSAWPVDAWWNFAPDTEPLLWKPRIDYQIFLVAMAAIDIGLDVFTLLLPIPVIQSLQMSRKRKISLIGVFALGFFCVISSAVRLYYAWRLHLVETGKLPITQITSIFASNDIWAHIEACASIVTACLPTIAPLVANLKPSGPLLSSIMSVLKGWGSTSSLLRGRGRKKTTETSSEISGTKSTWYKLETRSEAHPIDTRRRGDEESLINNPGSIHVQKSLDSKVNNIVDI